ncbi:hypothetical protein LCGC14_2826740, partial [marine sediment metagenome]
MARVPKSYPKEPGAKRCGDSYKTGLFVNGEIPGTALGREFKKTIGPVFFKNGAVSVPLFTSRTDLDAQLAVGFTKRFGDLKNTL